MAQDKHEKDDRNQAETERESAQALNERSHQERGVEKGDVMAPHQDRTPAEEHRGGPLPNQKR